MAKNAFDEVLASIGDDADRKATEALVEKYPHLRDGWLRNSDYSRKMDAHRDDLKFAEQARTWINQNLIQQEDGSWVTQAEMDLRKQLEEASASAKKGGEMTAEERERFVEKAEAEKLIAGLQQKMDQLQQAAAQATMLGYQMSKLEMGHQKEFGEPMDNDALVKIAQGKNIGLDLAYEAMVGQRRKEREQAEIAAKIEAAEKAGYEKAKQEITTSPGWTPDDQTGGDMTAMQRKVLGATPSGEVNIDSLPFGGGQLGAYLARTLPLQK